MYVHEVDILAQLSDAALLPFVLFPVVFFIVLCIFFRLFLLFRLCLIVFLNIYWGCSCQALKYLHINIEKKINGIFPEEQLTETKKTRGDWH